MTSYYNEVLGKFLSDSKWDHFNKAYASLFLKSSTEPLQENTEYMELTELKFILKNLRELCQIQLFQNFSKAGTITKKEDILIKSISLDQNKLCEEMEALSQAWQSLITYISSRLEATANAKLSYPRIVNLCMQYQFSSREVDLFHLMVVVQGSNNGAVLNALSEEDYLRKMTGFKRLSGLSDVDVDNFCDAERAHMKENIVAVDEENGTQYNLRIQNVAVQLLYGRKVRGDDLLKISQTSLEAILFAETNHLTDTTTTTTTGENLLSSSSLDGGLLLSGKKRVREALSDGEGEEGDGEGEVDGEEDEEMSYDDPDASITGSHQGGRLSGSRGPKLMRVHSWGPGSSAKGGYPLVATPHGSAVKKSRPSLSSTSPHGSLVNPVVSSTTPVNGHSAATKNNQHLIIDQDSTSSLQPYSSGPNNSQLEYLEDCFQWIALMIKGNVVKMKDDLKKEGTTSRLTNNWGDNMTDIKHSKRELVAKIKLQEHRIEKRLAKTKEQGLPLPRLEEIVERFQLDLFEKGLILLLIGKTVSPIVRTLLETLDAATAQHMTDDVINVGQALAILCHSFNDQIYSRRYFYQNSKLLLNALVTLTKPRWHSGSGDLTENKILLDRRILDYIVGLDSEINELVEGSDLYTPNISLDSVVLPKDYKDLLLSQCKAYDIYVLYKQRLLSGSATNNNNNSHVSGNNGSGSSDQAGLSTEAAAAGVKGITENKKKHVIAYGNSLVILLCGTPGTGKTMTVNAIATELKKKVLLCDFNSLVNKKDSSQHADIEIDLKGLFRESKLNNALLFFDECEHIFKNRNYTSDRLINSLLIEIEKHEGIVFLATNRAHELDEAMHRRITMVLEYNTPDKYMRKVIWDNLLDEKVYLHKDVDTSILASKYQLTGGFIKNAVLSAILMALSRDRQQPIIYQMDLLKACQLQMRGNLVQKSFESRIPNSQKIMKRLFVSEQHKIALQKIINFEKSRNTVYVEKASITLLAGLQGSGKYTIVETIATELNIKHIKYIHIGDFLYNNIYEVAEIFKLLIKDASILDAIIVINGFEHMLEESAYGGEGNKLLLTLSRIMEILYDFRGPVFLLANIDNPQNITLQRDFSSRLFAFLRLTLPSSELRGKLWRSLIPAGAPLGKDLDFTSLGKRFDLFPGGIQSAIAYAAAEVASREVNKTICQKDLLAAGEYEVAKCKGDHAEMIAKLFA
eukprot:gene2363-2594_t